MRNSERLDVFLKALHAGLSITLHLSRSSDTSYVSKKEDLNDAVTNADLDALSVRSTTCSLYTSRNSSFPTLLRLLSSCPHTFACSPGALASKMFGGIGPVFDCGTRGSSQKSA